ncbi:MAG: hypothetical protein L3J33_10250 [Rhodobacteraceae bacterium]|nr:hypothetical protein [Paracoccaceae bacterium]
MRFLFALIFFFIPAGITSAQTVSCQPVTACYLPQGECDPATADDGPGIFEFSDMKIRLTSPVDPQVIEFSVLEILSILSTTTYFTKHEFGAATFTLFNNGNLAMSVTDDIDGGIALVAYFTCEGAPWKTS